VKSVWSHAIEPAILSAGYESKRIDGHHHNNRIDDEIIALIRRSKFVVADFTGQRGGVYFEAGYALGHGLPVIWTIRKDDLKDVHFDNRQYNFLLWDEGDLEGFKVALQNRIEATLGRGSYKQGS
jgi:nucleoside 2-deoxyribosyltransferase